MARKYTSPYCDLIRAKIILLADEGLSNDCHRSPTGHPRVRSLANGANDSLLLDCLALSHSLGAGVKPAFPPSLVVQVKAPACELPVRLGLPLSRLSIGEIRQHVIAQGLVAEISGATLWRWLSSDALRPWLHRSWICPRDPQFAAKAGPVLDLYERIWEGVALGPDDFVLCFDEKNKYPSPAP